MSSLVKAFFEFVLDQYVKLGVDELDQETLGAFLELKYHTITDAAEELGGSRWAMAAAT